MSNYKDPTWGLQHVEDFMDEVLQFASLTFLGLIILAGSMVDWFLFSVGAGTPLVFFYLRGASDIR